MLVVLGLSGADCGGRFLGSACGHYIGIGPNSALRPSFEAMFSWLSDNHEHDKGWNIVWEPAKDVEFMSWHRQVDLIFTSPPYFNLE
tara:strand:+ start:129109 stop:129369 length:261 start_codon:yes stop_codon:yes gene_type:complete